MSLKTFDDTQTNHTDNRNHGYVALSSEPQAHEQYSPTDVLSNTQLPTTDSLHSTSHGGTLIVHPHGHSYTYSYGPKGLTGLFHNYYALGCAVFASLGGLTFGYDQGVIANVLVMKDFVTRWPISPLEKGLMSTSETLQRLQQNPIYCHSRSSCYA